MKPSEEQLAAARAQEEDARREAWAQEYEVESIVGAKRRGQQVLRLVQWKGGRELWGPCWRTWEKDIEDSQVWELWGAKKLQGRKIDVKYSVGVTSTAHVGKYDQRMKKHAITHTDGEAEFLDLLHGEKEWKLN